VSTTNGNGVWSDWPLILAYHSISDHRTDSLAVRPADFEYQIAWLQKHGYRSMTLAQFVTQTVEKGKRIVIITFDDGYADNYHLAYPILMRYGFAATVFLVSDYVGTDRILPPDQPKITKRSDQTLYSHLTWDQIHEMAAHNIEFGSHTCTHPRELTALSAAQHWQQIAHSRQDLQRKLGKDVISFCYPRGNLNGDVINTVEKAGYSCGVVTPPRWGIPLSRYTLRRIGIYHRNTPVTFRIKIMPIVRKYYEHYQWLKGKK